MSQTLVDTGPLVALLDRRDHRHAWAVEQAALLKRPFDTCEAVIAEAFHLLRTGASITVLFVAIHHGGA